MKLYQARSGRCETDIEVRIIVCPCACTGGGTGFFAFYYYSPVTSTVRLTDTSKSSLPFYGADITLEYADKSETRHVDRLSDEVVFKEIHTKYLGENARLKIESKGYVTVDTVLSLEKNVTLGISRDSSLAMIFGTVKDEDNRPLADATVQVLDMKTDI